MQNQQHKAHHPFNLKPHFVKLFSFNCTCPAPPHSCRRLPHYCVEATRRNLLACREPRTFHQTASRPELDPMGLGGSWVCKTRSLSTWCFLGNQGTFRAKPLCTTDGNSGECGKWWKSSFHAEVADLNAIDATETSTFMDAARFPRYPGVFAAPTRCYNGRRNDGRKLLDFAGTLFSDKPKYRIASEPLLCQPFFSGQDAFSAEKPSASSPRTDKAKKRTVTST